MRRLKSLVLGVLVLMVCLGSAIVQADEVDELIKQLKDKDVGVRMKAVETLCKIGDSRVVELLIPALKDKNTDVRRAASWMLGEM
ncbi:MAG: HEAT repeat domain-containing protein [bacterium]|nr:HEAT repeat domain-containing protein [bacterium]